MYNIVMLEYIRFLDTNREGIIQNVISMEGEKNGIPVEVAMIYNTSSAVTNATVCVLDFGSDKTATSGTFTIQFPAFTTAAAILRISG